MTPFWGVIGSHTHVHTVGCVFMIHLPCLNKQAYHGWGSGRGSSQCQGPRRCVCMPNRSFFFGRLCLSINQSVNHTHAYWPSFFFFFQLFLLLLGSQPCVGRRRRPVPSSICGGGGGGGGASSSGQVHLEPYGHMTRSTSARKACTPPGRPAASIRGGTTGRSSPQQTIMQPWEKCWNLGFWECQSINQGIAVPSEVGNADMDRCSSLQALIIPRSFLEFPRPVAMWPPPLPGGPYPFHAI